MTPNDSTDGIRLESNAAEQLLRELENVRREVLVEARRLSGGGAIDEHHLFHAWQRRSGFRAAELADVQYVISLALRENRFSEWLAYALALMLFAVGVVLLTWGAFVFDDAGYRFASLAGGSIVELLLLIPFRFAIDARRHNIAIRMLGLLIDRVDDPAKLARVLTETFSLIVAGRRPINGSQ